MNHIFFIIPNGLHLGVIDSQIMAPRNYLLPEVRCSYFFESGNTLEKYRSQMVEGVYHLSAIGYVTKYLRGEKICIFYRSVWNAWDALKLKIRYKNVITLYDVRGVAAEELYLKNQNILKFTLIKIAEFISINLSDKVFTVSQKLRDYVYRRSYNKDKIRVVPCCIEEVRQIEFKEEQKNEINFVYIGSLSKWQKFDDVIALFGEIKSVVDCASLTIFTKDIEEASSKIEKNKVKNVIVESKSRDELLEILPNFDLGFLLRDDILVNNVASPIKFLEYSSCGVIPIMSRNIGDFSEIAEEKEACIIVEQLESFNTLAIINNLKKMKTLKKNAVELSADFTWQKFASQYIEIFN